MDLVYTRQKARDALDCLTSDGSLDYRLTNAGMALTLVPKRGLPTAVGRQLLVAKRAFTSYPEAWRERPGWDGDIPALMRLLPGMRKRLLVAMVVDLFETICTLKSDAEPENIKSSDQELPNPDRWEFLFWNLGHTDSSSIKETYVQYAQTWLPNLPQDVLLEWPGRHGYHGFRDWSHLDLENLKFQDADFSLHELVRIQTVDASFSEVGPESHGYFHLHREGDWIGGYIREYGTWSAPIIVLQQPVAATISGRSVEPGLVLIEGHQRLSRLLNWPAAKSRSHRVMLCRQA